MFIILVLLFTIIPAVEIYLLFAVGGQIGSLNTVLVIILTGILGATLAKSEGLSIINKIQNDLAKGSIPTDQLIHCLLIFGGGLLLLTPGFLTDALGFSMVIPGTRKLISLFLKSTFSKMINSGSVKFYTSGNFENNQSQNPRRDQENNNEIAEKTFEAEYNKINKKTE